MKPRIWFVIWIATMTVACGGGDSPDPAAGAAPFRGEYSYFADASAFVSCADAKRYPVTGPENASLERAYAAAAFWPGDWVMIEVEGRLEERPAMEGDGSETTLVVTGVGSVQGNSLCLSGSNEEAAGTYSVGLPPASSPGTRLSLVLRRNGRGALVTEYTSDEAVVVERGSWSTEGEDHVRLVLESVGEDPQPGDLVFLVGRQGDLLYEGENYGTDGLKLKKSRYRAGSERIERLLAYLEVIVVDYGGQVPPNGILYEHKLRDLLREESMQMSLLGMLSQEFGVSPETLEREWSSLETVADVIELVEHED